MKGVNMSFYVMEVHEYELVNFPAWGGAVPRLEELVEHDRAYEAVRQYVEDFIACTVETPLGVVYTSKADVNDFFWFDLDEWLVDEGFKDAEDNWLPCAG